MNARRLWLVAIGLVLALGLAESRANLTNTWHYTNAVQYTASNARLIGVNPTPPGWAELILQSRDWFDDRMSDYDTGGIPPTLGVSWPAQIEIPQTADTGRYFGQAVYESRVFKAPLGSEWNVLSARVFNDTLPRSFASTTTNLMPGIVGLWRVDNVGTDAMGLSNFSGGSFSTNSVLGSHAMAVPGPSGTFVPEISTDFTLSFWLLMSSFSASGYDSPIGFARGAARSMHVSIGRATLHGQVPFGIALWSHLDGPLATAQSEPNIYPEAYSNQWRHVVVTFSGAATPRVRFYIDGQLQPLRQDAPFASISIPNTVRFGRRGDSWVGANLNGLLDEVVVLNRAITDAEVLALLNAGANVRFQVRSGLTPTLTGPFVGPSGDSGTFYSGKNDLLVSGGGFNRAFPYMQIRAQLFGTHNHNATPTIEWIGMHGTLGTRHIQTRYDFQSDYIGRPDSVVIRDVWMQGRYGALAPKKGGGYERLGEYISRPLTNATGQTAIWSSLNWYSPQRTTNTMSGLVGLFHLDGNWVDVAAGGGDNSASTLVDIGFSPNAKIGLQAATFSGASHVTGFGFGNIQSVSMWINTQELGGDLLNFGGAARIRIWDGMLSAEGFTGTSPGLFLNGKSGIRLEPGWNHVAVVFPTPISGASLRVGNEFIGKIDELSVFSRSLELGEIAQLSLQGMRTAAGSLIFSVRTADTEAGLASAPWFGSFRDPSLARFSYQGRFFQYRVQLGGDGEDPAVFGNVQARGSTAQGNFVVEDAFWRDTSAGSFTATRWHGDRVAFRDLSLAKPANKPALSDIDPNYDGAVGIWNLDESSWAMGRPIIDSKSGRNGLASGGARASTLAHVGVGCGSFEGSGQHVTLGFCPEFSTDRFSVSVWASSESTALSGLITTHGQTRWMAILMNSDGVSHIPGRVSFAVANGADVRAASFQYGGNSDGNWHNYTGVRDGRYIHLFINGIRVATTDLGAAFPMLNSASPQLARHGTHFFTGFLDEVIVWNRALTDTEVGAHAQKGFVAGRTEEIVSGIVDAEGPSIWQQLFWAVDAPYSRPLSSDAEGIVALWRFEEQTGVQAVDSVAGVRGTLSGTANLNVDGRHGSGVSLNGGSISYAAPAATPTAVSLSLWFRPTAIAATDLLRRGGQYGLAIDSNGRPVFSVQGTSVTGRMAIRRDEWVHIAGTYDGNRLRLYVNGRINAMVDAIGLSTAGSATLASGPFSGILDEVALFSTTLTPQVVYDHYISGAVRLRFQCRVSDDPTFGGSSSPVPFTGPDGTANTYFTDFFGSDLVGALPIGRYFQWRAVFSTDDALITPALYGVKVFISNYPTTAPFIEVADAAAVPFFGRLLSFLDLRTFEPGTEIQYQITGDLSTRPDVRWFYWGGSSWVQENGLGYDLNTSTRDVINANIGSFYDQLYDKVGGNLRIRSFHKSGGEYQSALDWVRVVQSRGRVTVLTPNGMERDDKAWISRVRYDIEWEWAGQVGSNLELHYTTKGPNATGADWILIATVPRGATGRGVYSWLVPQHAFETNCYVRIRDPNDATIFDRSDAAFSIVQRFRVTAPNDGEKWYAGRTHNITWEASYNLGTLAQIHYAPDGSNFTHQVAFATRSDSESKTNAFAWAISGFDSTLISETGRIRVMRPQVEGVDPLADVSDGTFTLAGAIVTAPTEGRLLKRGDPFTIQWVSAGAGPAVGIDLSSDGGTTFAPIIPSAPNRSGTNSVVWQVQQPGTDFAVLRIRSLSDTNIVNVSRMFVLADIEVTSPINNEVWLRESRQTITWTSGGAGDRVKLDYSINAGDSWMPIVADAPNTGSYTWTVSHRVSPRARVRVTSLLDTNLAAISARNFNIAGVRVLYPNTQEDTLRLGTRYWMRHDAAPEAWQGIRLEVSHDGGDTYAPFNNLATNWSLGSPFQFTALRPTLRARFRATVNESPGFTNVFDISDEDVTIAGVLVTEPATGQSFTMGEVGRIRWTSAGTFISPIQLFYSEDGRDITYRALAAVGNNENFPGNNVWNWNISRDLIPSTEARVRIVAGSYTNTSDAFTLRGMRITWPATNTVWDIASGTPQTMLWRSAGISPTSRGRILLSLNGGASYPYELENNFPLIDFSFYNWTIDPTLDPTTNAVIRFTIDTSAVTNDVSLYAESERFTLRGIKVKAPLAGANWELGSQRRIEFLAAGAGGHASIFYSVDGGQTFDARPIVRNMTVTNGLNAFDWTIEWDREPSTNVVLSIVSPTASARTAPFTVGGVKVLRPMGFDIWAAGDISPIQWLAVGAQGVSTIHLLYPEGGEHLIAANVSGSRIDWQVTSAAMQGKDTLTNVTVRVRDSGGYQGVSEPFKIVSTPRIEIVDPAEGVYWKAGQRYNVRWLKGGEMFADEFAVYFSIDGGPLQLINNPVRFNPDNNVFSIEWFVRDILGEAQVLVSNTVRTTIFEYSKPFEVVGTLKLYYPNGTPTEAPIHALRPVNVSWSTLGSIEHVNLFYQVNNGPWTKINRDPLPNNKGLELIETFTSYQWTPPNVQTLNARFRVQDAAYPLVYDGIAPGPYDDSDDAFQIRYYTVLWDVFYVDANNVTNRLDRLSVADSSGWAESNLSAVNASGDTKAPPRYIVRQYPYGMYTTLWIREFFGDAIDFHWRCDRDHVRSIEMRQTDTQPNYNVMASFAYLIDGRTFTINSWLERAGTIFTNPQECRVQIYDSAGNLLEVLQTSRHHQGVFWLNWHVNSTVERIRANTGNPRFDFTSTDVFFAKVQINFSGIWYSAGLTFALRLAAGEETVQAIEAIVSAATSNILDGVDAVGVRVNSISTTLGDFRAEAMAGITNLTEQSALLNSNMTNIVVPGILRLTNDVAVLTGVSTQTLERVTRIDETTEQSLARILTRPQTVVLGSTNTFLYKTRRGYGHGVVDISVRDQDNTPRHTSKMTEIGGLGIYSAELVANWGLGRKLIECSDPNASDTIIVEVVAVNPFELMGSMQQELNSVQTNVQAMSGVVFRIEDLVGMSAVISNDLARLHDIVTNQFQQIEWEDVRAIGAAVGAISNRLETLEGLREISQKIGAITNAMTELVALTNLTADIADLRTKLGAMDWADVLAIRSSVLGVSNIVAGITGIEDVVGALRDTTNAIAAISQVTNLASEIAGVREAIRDIDLVDIGNNVQSLTNALPFMAKTVDILAGVESANQGIRALNSLTNLPSAFNEVSNSLAAIEWNDVLAIRSDLGAVSNAIAGLRGIDEISRQLGEMTNALVEVMAITNISDAVDDLTVAMRDVDWRDIVAIRENVNTLTNTLEALPDLTDIAPRMDALREAVNNIGNVAGLAQAVSAISNQLASVDWSQMPQIREQVERVAAQVATLNEIRQSAADVKGQIDTLAENLRGLEGVDLAAVDFDELASLGGSISPIVEAVTSLTRTLGSADDGADVESVFGKLAAVGGRLGGIEDDASAAVSRAQGARSAAEGARGAVREVIDLLLSGDVVGARDAIARIGQSVESAQAELALVSREWQINELFKRVADMDETVRKIAENTGIKLPETEPGQMEEAGVITKDDVASLLLKIQDLNAEISFMKKMLDEIKNEPEVHMEFIGST